MSLALSIVIPCHNRPDLLRACLTSIRRHCPPDTEILVIDDASPHETVTATARVFPDVSVVRLPERSGFCVAANAGIAAARRPIVELLNDDTEVNAGWADAALAHFVDPFVGAVAPLVLRWPGPPTETRIDSAGDRYHLGGFARKHGRDEFLGREPLGSRSVFGASASSAFYRRDALLRVGAFPADFGAYSEDVDLSFRLHRAGYRIVFEPVSRVLHHVSASYQQRPCPDVLEQQSRNEELVFWRNVPPRQWFTAVPLHLTVLLAKAWRRWRRGELLPFLRGRLRAWRWLPGWAEHRRRLCVLGPDVGPRAWHLDTIG